MTPVLVEGAAKSPRDINRAIKAHIAAGNAEIHIANPDAQHNLAVGLVEPITLRFLGSVGYYCGGMGHGPVIHIEGSTGWGVAEGILGGEIVIEGNAGNGAGAAMRGGIVVVRGNTGARAGVSIKGGTLLIGGNAGHATGFMGQKGRIIICGDAEAALGDSMYETVIYSAGEVADPGNDTVIETPAPEEIAELNALTAKYALQPRGTWKKIVSGRKLWTFDKRDAAWRDIL
jgi:glutamate synthase domain-containing protein 3